MPNIKEWLNKHNVPYDEIIVGKPWCGENGFYIDDKALRPDEFLTLDNNSIKSILNKENKNQSIESYDELKEILLNRV